MATIPAGFLLFLLAQAPAPADAAPSAIAEARAHYNAGRAAEALAAVQPLVTRPGSPPAAALVAARALLERYRVSGDTADLTSAREHLRALDASAFSGSERREMVIGLAEALYLEDAFASAAELFETALATSAATALDPASRERVLDWWATALDRHAQPKPANERRGIYLRIAERMDRESRENPASAPAAYWLAAGARGAGELDRAWAASIAAWVRASMTLDRGAALRADIDRLVLQALIPERARVLGLSAKETEQAQAGMLAEWELIKRNWSR
jgi:hypothetical protein